MPDTSSQVLFTTTEITPWVLTKILNISLPDQPTDSGNTDGGDDSGG